MVSFALVTEGITDQIVLESILTGFYCDDDLDVKYLQPLRDVTDSSRQSGFAGWELVLEYCSRHEILAEALLFSDYLIIQIDTDCGEHENYGVSLTVGGVDKSVEQLICDVRAKIDAILGDAFLKDYGDKVFYAICVHSLECWLLPLFSRRKSDIDRTKACEAQLSHVWRKGGNHYVKDADCYRELSLRCGKTKVLANLQTDSCSLRLFLESLPPLVEA